MGIGFGRFAFIDRIETELADYFGGVPVHFQTPLVLNTPALARTVWRALRKMPYGNT